ncbi:MAG TPA: alpha/beta hydrolase [Gemmatimonadales bacterium]|nr:alpha/beta hydrolase [Gemmatimonadales bacterium]
MRTSHSLWLALLAITFTAQGCNRVTKNISYDPAGTDSLTALDIYPPRFGGHHPVVIFIHGGSYVEGDKSTEVGAKPKEFRSRGYVFVAVNYRLSPAVKHPVHIQNVAKAIAWVRHNIGRYGGDSTRLFVMGHSSGASMAALIATNERYLKAEGLDLNALSGAILLDGSAYDVPRRFSDDSLEAHRLLAIFGDDPAGWEDGSAIYHCQKGKGIPPFLMFYLTARAGGTQQSQALAGALATAGVKVEIKPIQTLGHYKLNLELGLETNPATADVFSFLKTYSAPRTLAGGPGPLPALQ